MIIFLYGPPASGKSTLGDKLAKKIDAKFVDLDAVIEKTAGRTIPEIFASQGEDAFRDMESACLTETIAHLKADGVRCVLSLGGGTLLRRENRLACEEAGDILSIDAPSEEEIARRMSNAPLSRPLGNKAVERADHYASFPNRIAVFFEAQESLVIVGKSVASTFLRGADVVADANVSRLWGEKLNLNPFVEIPSGEKNKTIDTVSMLWRAFAKKGLGRKDCVVALGGGVTGDLTGFAAATWMRGIKWINIPTTLLSMVDASTGGKTGCDLAEGKNLAGVFHFPALVVVDADFLETLPPQVLADGRAEFIKHEIISGRATNESLIEKSFTPSPKKIAENLLVKAAIVREDPFETKNLRMLLNCGHTIAHAVEKLSGYSISHGEAVAIGCCEEARVAVRRGLAPKTWEKEIESAFSAAFLPTSLPQGMDKSSIVMVMKCDKKRAGDVVSFALPCGWGDVRIVPIDLSKEDVWK
jgi:3-dehydroquinate synthetase